MPVTVNETLDGHAAPDLEYLDRDMTRKCPCLLWVPRTMSRSLISGFTARLGDLKISGPDRSRTRRRDRLTLFAGGSATSSQARK